MFKQSNVANFNHMIIPTQLSEVKFEQIFTSNDNIKHKLANGTPCGGQYIVLKDNVSFKLEIFLFFQFTNGN